MKKIGYLFLTFLFLVIPFNNCAQQSNQQLSSTASCTNPPDELRSPNSITEAVQLMNALPKPFDVNCFIQALRKPLKVFAVNNAFSAQPAVGASSPRIFILNSRLSLSVAPAGSGKYLLEMSEKETSGESFKAELEFPVKAEMDPSVVFRNVISGGSSRCVTCHTNEHASSYPNAGTVFSSTTIRPSEAQRVSQTYLKNQALNCTGDKYRCDMLRAIYIEGQAMDASFAF